MLVAGLASSHAPTMFLKLPDWEAVHERLVRTVPQPVAAQAETDETNQESLRRIGNGFAARSREPRHLRAHQMSCLRR